MTAPVLVAYATRYGSTREVAEAVATTLRERGLDVDVQPMREIRSLEGRRGIVLGAPFYIGHWPKEAQRFLSEHRDGLTQCSVAVFALGPLSSAKQEMLDARDQLDKELKNHPWLTPVDAEVFIGKYDPSKLSFWHKIIAALPASPLHGLPGSDLRDWTAIRAWASDLAQKLQPVSSR